MDDSAPQPGYHNYEQTESRKELNLKKILIGFGILIAVLATGYFIIQAIKVANDTYNEDEEPLIEYVENAEPLAGLQFLTESGLDDKQYKQVTETLSKYFQENHSEYKVVQYVDATFDDSRAFTEEGCELQDILDEEEETYRCSVVEFAPLIMKFELVSDNDVRYFAEIEIDGMTTTTHLFDADNNKLI